MRAAASPTRSVQPATAPPEIETVRIPLQFSAEALQIPNENDLWAYNLRLNNEVVYSQKYYGRPVHGQNDVEQWAVEKIQKLMREL